METCVYCGQPAQGNYSIHRDGFGTGPEVPLCDECGGEEYPTCGEIWEVIAEPDPQNETPPDRKGRGA